MKRRWQDPRDPTVGRELGSEGGLLRTEFERRGVDAVPQPRRPRPVIEHVPQVGTAVGTFDLRAAHEQAPILLLANISFLNGRPETRPAGPRVELGPRREEFGPADDAQIHARVVVVPIFAGEGSLGPLVHDDVVLKRRKLLQLRLVELLHGLGRTLRRLKVSARSRRAKKPRAGPKSPELRLRRVRILLPQGQPGARGIFEYGEPALAHDLGLRHDDLPTGLLDLLLILVDRGDGQVIDDPRLPVARLEAPDAATRTACRLEERVVHSRDFLEFPPEHGSIEFLKFLRFLDVELDVYDTTRFWLLCHRLTS